MSLSWGHGTPPPPPTQRSNSPLGRFGFALAGAAVVVVGVVLGVLTRTGPSDDDAARQAIAAILQQQRAAMDGRDIDRYMSTVDPGRVFLRRCEEERFAAIARIGVRAPLMTLGRMETYLDYVRGWVDFGDGWRRMFFRNDGARWYMSEPTSGELGDDRTREYAGVRVSYREAEADLIDAVGRDLPSIIDSVLVDAPAAPSQLFSLRIATLTSSDGRCFVAGEARSSGTTQITLRQINLTNRYDQLSVETTNTLRHEALHWVQADHAKRAHDRADWWVLEGWPFLLANKPSFGERQRVVCRATPPSFSDLRFGPGPTTSIETTEGYYVVASLLVERLYDKTSGAAGYWRLFDAFDAPPDASPYMTALGVDGPAMYSTWLESARTRYC